MPCHRRALSIFEIELIAFGAFGDATRLLTAETSVTNEKFVGKNTQAVDRGGFDSKNDRAKRDGPTSVRACKGELGRSEVALGTDEHQDIFW